ncbi:cellulose binding domain-containing protein [Microbispora sp. NEAU-D428]|uniref:cellulose binding domain-containing protein n=1 Tax=Microbispora sitophila TaxID=2771537 RepID=UPI001867606C|nr:cellulose binding domain-containing protein [Microbispora sitophila]MBE3009704.1 cellulose binding domain-containing protein [Microbispora sitophila]
MIRRTIATAALVLAAAGLTAAPAAADSIGCEASYTITSVWPGTRDAAVLGQVTVTNTGSSAIKGWRVSWRFTDGSVITQVWGAVPLPVIGVVGMYAFGNESYNGDLPIGGSTVFGFTARLGGGKAPDVTCTPV